MMSCRNLFVLVLVLCHAPVVRAAGGSEARERAARTACLAGDYTKGVALLAELFVDSRDPTHIYNQGRCFEQNRRYEDAIGRFQEYLRVGRGLGDAERAEAQKHIADCKELLASQAPASPPAAPLPAAPPAPATPTIVEPAQVAAQGASTGAGLRTAGVITAAVGGAALVGAVLINLKANGMADDLQKPNGYTDGKESDRKTYVTLGWVGYGVGAACVATGAVLYVLGLRAQGQTAVALVPSVAAGRAGLVLEGAF